MTEQFPDLNRPHTQRFVILNCSVGVQVVEVEVACFDPSRLVRHLEIPQSAFASQNHYQVHRQKLLFVRQGLLVEIECQD